jgi:hypothetical protein
MMTLTMGWAGQQHACEGISGSVAGRHSRTGSLNPGCLPNILLASRRLIRLVRATGPIRVGRRPGPRRGPERRTLVMRAAYRIDGTKIRL